ncbi:hypothetical protein MetMK1DRAFT_00002610 [Metallosphaera yellowstonensis MK1]|uniref:Uncharacterized protein n=1 Tax=Metallosphaera yellowstonensis MK1 TaxID=671065 RepID=H2C494_9CREN|nr:hypothetical protein MetMK1DRAFT_00002610 [Metallosphaera yellowstonensis MK1]
MKLLNGSLGKHSVESIRDVNISFPQPLLRREKRCLRNLSLSTS